MTSSGRVVFGLDSLLAIGGSGGLASPEGYSRLKAEFYDTGIATFPLSPLSRRDFSGPLMAFKMFARTDLRCSSMWLGRLPLQVLEFRRAGAAIYPCPCGASSPIC